jgi:pimeloyl-ACP methyl ester carboxylesterase
MLFSGNSRQVEGVRLFWRSSGRGPHLVLIHGMLMSHRVWDQVLEQLAERCAVVALDLPGYGESDCPERYPYSLDAFSHSVAVLLDSLGLSRVALMGHSLGCAIALNMAVRYPERVDRLVLASPVVYPLQMPWEGQLALLPKVGELLFQKLYRKRQLRHFFRRDIYHLPAFPTDEALDYYWSRFDRPGGRLAAFRTLEAITRLELSQEVPERVSCPTLVVWGEEDQLVRREAIQRLGSALRRGSLYTLAGTGHAPMEEFPDRFCAGVLPFLEE